MEKTGKWIIHISYNVTVYMVYTLEKGGSYENMTEDW